MIDRWEYRYLADSFPRLAVISIVTCKLFIYYPTPMPAANIGAGQERHVCLEMDTLVEACR